MIHLATNTWIKSSTAIIKIIPFFLLAAFVFMPFAVLWIFIAGTAFYAAISNTRPKKLAILIFSLLVILLTPYMATKTGLSVVGNDKLQYTDFMYGLVNGNLFQIELGHPEIVSFTLLKISAELFGPSNEAFATFFAISFIIFLIGIYRTDPRASLTFIMLFLSSSVFFNIYGNGIRQGLALSLFLVFISEIKTKKYFFLTLALLSHLSIGALLPYIFLRRIIVGLDNKRVLAVCAASYLSGYAVMPLMEGFSSSWGYLERKRTLYMNYISSETGIAKVTFLLLLTIVILTKSSFFRKLIKQNSRLSTKQQFALDSLYSVTIYLSFLLFFVMQVMDFFARYYMYYLVFCVFYITVFIYNLDNTRYRAIGTFLIIVFSTASLIKSFLNFSLFYCGNSNEFLTDNIISVYMCM